MPQTLCCPRSLRCHPEACRDTRKNCLTEYRSIKILFFVASTTTLPTWTPPLVRLRLPSPSVLATASFVLSYRACPCEGRRCSEKLRPGSRTPIRARRRTLPSSPPDTPSRRCHRCAVATARRSASSSSFHLRPPVPPRSHTARGGVKLLLRHFQVERSISSMTPAYGASFGRWGGRFLR